MLRFSPANAKTANLANDSELQTFLGAKRKVYSFDLLSGHSCPFAKECFSKVVDGKIVDGPDTEFRCFSASQEALYPNVFKSRSRNFNHIKQNLKPDVIEAYMPKNLGICRIHVAGDFFSPKYLQLWIDVANNNSRQLFYAYTKSLPYWLKLRKQIRQTKNLVLTASYGGRKDELIRQHRLRFARVIFKESDARKLPIDHDDTHAAKQSLRNKSFCLLLHGIQPKGTPAAKALVKLKGKGSYSRMKN